MVNRTGFFAMAVLLATTLVPATLRAAAEEPVATAVIPPLPPPAPPIPSTPKAAAAATPAKPSAPPAAKPGAGAAARKAIEHRHMAAHRVHRRTEHRRLIAQVAPPPRPAMPPRYYPGPPATGPQALEGPSMPPPWYDRGRPLAFYPYPGPRGPMPPW